MTNCEQAYGNIFANLETLATDLEGWASQARRHAPGGYRQGAYEHAANAVRTLLASSAPATASEGATTSATDGADHHDGDRRDDSPEHGERGDDEPGQHGGTLTAAAGEGTMEARCGCTIGGLHRYACGLVGHVDPPRPAGVTSSDGDRGLSEENEHVEWRVESESLEDEFGTDEEGARKWLVVCRTKPGWEPVTLMRRTVRTVVGPWEVVGDE